MVTDAVHVSSEIGVGFVPRPMSFQKLVQMTTGFLRSVEHLVVRATRAAHAVDVCAELAQQLESELCFRDESGVKRTHPSYTPLQIRMLGALARGHL